MERAKELGKRIAAVRAARGMSQGDLAKAVNASQSAVSFWEKGQREPTRDTVARIAAELGVELDDLEAVGVNESTAPVAVVGYVGAGAVAVLFSEGQGPFDYVDPPRSRKPTTVGLEIKGVSLGPAFDNGIVFYDDVRSPVTPDLLGKLCVVGLADGRVLVKILQGAAQGRYHLLSNTAEPPLLDAAVDWAARVKEVRPA